MDESSVYGSVLFIAFISATILPAQSEVALAALILSERYSTGGLIIAASFGNVLGSLLNWTLGRIIESRGRRWFPVRPGGLDRAERWYRRYGRWTLLLSWVPVVGDPLTVVAGILREPLWSFLMIVGIAKIGRYLIVAAIAIQWDFSSPS